MSWIIGGILLGLLSSLHCVGMCGPLAMALPVNQLSKVKKMAAILLHQVGRITTYSLMGLVLGWAGSRLNLAGFQQGFSVFLGVVVIVLVTGYYYHKFQVRFRFMQRLFAWVQRWMGYWLTSSKSLWSFLFIGVGNGLLPCGMVYIAIATALTGNNVNDSVLFMAMFGLGTLPAMMAAGYLGAMVNINVRRKLQSLVPIIMMLTGVLLILRGLNLGIPYISPIMPHTPSDAVLCH